MSVTIPDGGLVTKDSSESLVYAFDYDAENLAPSVQLATYGTFVITKDDVVTAEVTQDNQSFLALSGNRKVRVRLSGGTVGATYRIEHTVSTNEAPNQVKSKWFYLRITE